MSQNNAKDEMTGVAIVIAFIGGMAILFFLFLYVVAAFVALVLTIVCFFAWNSSLHLGSMTIIPEAARAFVYRGLAGTVLIAAFTIFLAIVFGVKIVDAYVPHILLAGYTAGSIGIEILMAQDANEAAPHQTIIPPSQQIAPPRTNEPSPQPFRFASWDDEDGR